jgi:hypothetical protein
LKLQKIYKVVVQDGAEQRSNPSAQSAVQYMKDGKLGEVYHGKRYYAINGASLLASILTDIWRKMKLMLNTVDSNSYVGPFTKSYMEKVDYDMWLGPAPSKTISTAIVFITTGIGTGIMAMAIWAIRAFMKWMLPDGDLGVKYPSKVSAVGGRMMFNDDQQTPNVLMAMFEFPNEDGGGDKKKILQFEVRHWMSKP